MPENRLKKKNAWHLKSHSKNLWKNVEIEKIMNEEINPISSDLTLPGKIETSFVS